MKAESFNSVQGFETRALSTTAGSSRILDSHPALTGGGDDGVYQEAHKGALSDSLVLGLTTTGSDWSTRVNHITIVYWPALVIGRQGLTTLP